MDLERDISFGALERQLYTELKGVLQIDAPNFLELHFRISDALINQIFQRATAVGDNTESLYNTTTGMWRGMDSLEHEGQGHDFAELLNNITDLLPKSMIRGRKTWQHSDVRTSITKETRVSSILPAMAATSTPSDRFPHVKNMHVVLEYYQGQGVDADVDRVMLIHLRQLLVQCPDRRFAFGITVGRFGQFRVYIADRSGVVGSELISMNSDPRAFIRLAVGIQTAAPEALGWDTTMRLILREKKGPKLFSFDVPADQHDGYYFTVGVSVSSTGDAYSGVYDKREWIVLFEQANSQVNCGIVGNGLRVWNAWWSRDMNLPQTQRPTYLVKNAYNLLTETSEGDMLMHIGPAVGVPRLHCYENVKIDRRVDTTTTSRRGVVPSKQWPLWEAVSNNVTSESVPTLQARKHQRTVLATCGVPLNRFKSCLELVEVLQDVVQGHRKSCERDFLHLGIVPASIIIARSQINYKMVSSSKKDGYFPPKRARGALVDFGFMNVVEHNTAIGPWSFASCEVLDKASMLPSAGGKPWAYDVCHDLEAIFWIIVYLAVTVAHPGGIIRRPPYADGFSAIFNHLFGPSPLLKREIFQQGKQKLEETILPHVTAYCEPLRHIILDYFLVLRRAYQKRDFEGLHRQVFKVLADGAAMILRSYPPLGQGVGASNREEARRRREGINLPSTEFTISLPPTIKEAKVKSLKRPAPEQTADEKRAAKRR